MPFAITLSYIFFFIIARFLHILQLLVQDPAPSSNPSSSSSTSSSSSGSQNQMLPSILSFVMNQIYPVISEKVVPDIKIVLYELLHLILLNNWRWEEEDEYLYWLMRSGYLYCYFTHCFRFPVFSLSFHIISTQVHMITLCMCVCVCLSVCLSVKVPNL